MASEDRTADADETTMEELRRLAADARRAQSHHETPAQPTRTEDADAVTLEELRRLAHEAKAGHAASSERSVGPDDVWSSPQTGAPHTAPPSAAVNLSAALTPPPPPVLSGDVTVSPTSPTRPAPAAPVAPGAPTSPPVSGGARWTPPARTMLPTEPERQVAARPGPWKRVAVVLAAVVVALTVVLAIAVLGGSDDDQPTDGSMPDSSTEVTVGD